MRFGRHMPLGANAVRALATAREIGCDTAQVFLTNPRGWRVPDTNTRQEVAFCKVAQEQDIVPVVVHATYLINLASPRDDFFEQSITLLRATLERAERYGCASVVFHIGSHLGAGEEAGLKRLEQGIRRVLDGAPESVLLLLENDVGGGGKLGYRFENLAAVLASLPEYERQLGVCLDTAHLWGAGFDISTPEGAEQTLAQVEQTITLARVPVIHLNDTPKALGSHLDNHARIGEGVIPEAGLSAFLRHPGLADATILLETPIAELPNGQQDWDADRDHMRRARALAGLEMPAST
jgi:deoxyribonuclease-4